MKALHTIAFILVIIGALNWLAVSLFSTNVVDLIGYTPAQIVYILVGVSAIYLIFTHKKTCRDCASTTPAAPTM